MLTDKHCKNALSSADRERASFIHLDGLNLDVSVAESTRCFWRVYADGKEGRLALGAYPAMNVGDARKVRDAAKFNKSEIPDPVQVYKLGNIRAARLEGDNSVRSALYALGLGQEQSWHGFQAIVVHEFCYLHHRDHPEIFWNLVDKVMPDYRDRKDWLRVRGADLDF